MGGSNFGSASNIGGKSGPLMDDEIYKYAEINSWRESHWHAEEDEEGITPNHILSVCNTIQDISDTSYFYEEEEIFEEESEDEICDTAKGLYLQCKNSFNDANVLSLISILTNDVLFTSFIQEITIDHCKVLKIVPDILNNKYCTLLNSKSIGKLFLLTATIIEKFPNMIRYDFFDSIITDAEVYIEDFDFQIILFNYLISPAVKDNDSYEYTNSIHQTTTSFTQFLSKNCIQAIFKQAKSNNKVEGIFPIILEKMITNVTPKIIIPVLEKHFPMRNLETYLFSGHLNIIELYISIFEGCLRTGIYFEINKVFQSNYIKALLQIHLSNEAFIHKENIIFDFMLLYSHYLYKNFQKISIHALPDGY